MIRTLVRGSRFYGPLLAVTVTTGCSHLLGDYAKPGEVIQANPIVGTDPQTGVSKTLGYGVPPVNGAKASTIYNDKNGDTANVATGDTSADQFAKPVGAIGTILGPAAYGAAGVAAAAITRGGEGIINNVTADPVADASAAAKSQAQAAKTLANYQIPVTGKQLGDNNQIQVVVPYPGQPSGGQGGKSSSVQPGGTW